MWKGCGHCKKLAPALEEAAQKMKEVDPAIVFAKVRAMSDCVEQEKRELTLVDVEGSAPGTLALLFCVVDC